MDDRRHHLGRRDEGASGGPSSRAAARRATGRARRGGHKLRCRGARDDPLGDLAAGTSGSASSTTAARPRRRASAPARPCRHCRAGWRRHARRRRPALRSSIASASPSISSSLPGKRRRSSASGGRQRRSRSTAITSAPARAARGSGRRGRGRPHRRARPPSGPGMRAIRSSNCSSSRKFWPSAFDALRPWRAMTSRSGGSVAHRASARARRCAFAAMRIAAIIARGSARSVAGNVERGAMVGRGAHDRQAERDVDAFVEMQRLERDQRLVVIHAQRRVVVARGAARMEHGVGGVRAGDRRAFGLRAARSPA